MTKKKKITFILNPKSGTHSKDEIPAMIEQILDKELFDIEICFTEYRGHAAEIAKHKAYKYHHKLDGSVSVEKKN